MPAFSRAEITLHKAREEGSLMRSGKFSINSVIIRQHSDGNLQFTLRDRKFKTGPEIIIETEFSWDE